MIISYLLKRHVENRSLVYNSKIIFCGIEFICAEVPDASCTTRRGFEEQTGLSLTGDRPELGFQTFHQFHQVNARMVFKESPCLVSSSSLAPGTVLAVGRRGSLRYVTGLYYNCLFSP